MDLKQARLLPSGCQANHPLVLAGAGGKFAYCSTLSIYVFNTTDFSLECLFTGHDKTITCITWNRHDANFFATAGKDNAILIWNISRGKRGIKVELGSTPYALDWHPGQKKTITVGCRDGGIYAWDYGAATMKELLRTSASAITVVRWNNSKVGRLAVGHSNGAVTLFDSASGKTSSINEGGGRGAVIDVQWDPLSDQYCLVAYKSGHMTMFDMEREAAVQQFEPQPMGLTGVAWMRWSPGSFATVDSASGVMKVWNVSQRLPASTIRVADTGFSAIMMMTGTRSAVCGFVNGAVGVFDLAKRVMRYQGPPGHTETIFDLKYSPKSQAVLATASYDSTIKLWNADSLACTATLRGAEGVLYSLSWSPDSTKVVAATSKGEVLLWDAETGQLVKQTVLSGDACFRVQWHPVDQRRIAVSCTNGHVYLVDDDLNKVETLNARQPCYGLEWNPANPGMLAVGCNDGIVRVFDVKEDTRKPIRQLRELTKKTFVVSWNPVLPNLIAAGGDDHAIATFDLQTGRTQRLEGHTHNIRSLAWSHELPYVLLSGSWDASIRVWDIRGAGVCLNIVSDHFADIYGLSSHSNRPFVFTSSSRDTSARWWQLTGHIERLKAQAIVELSLEGVMGEAAAAMAHDAPPMLCGDGSKRVAAAVAEATDDIDKLAMIYEFFSDAKGISQLWQLVRDVAEDRSSGAVQSALSSAVNSYASGAAAVKGSQKAAAARVIATVGVAGASSVPLLGNDTVFHAKRLMPELQGYAAALEAVKLRRQAGSMRVAKKEDLIRQAAKAHLATGNIRKYCELMAAVGDWEHALALAGGVGPECWRELADRYLDQLLMKESEDAAAYLQATHRIDDLIAFHRQRDDLPAALLTAEVNEVTGFQQTANVSEAAASEAAATPRHKARTQGQKASDMTVQIAAQSAARYMRAAQPVMAACAYLSVSRVLEAMNCLLRGGETDLAFAISSILDLRPRDIIVEAMSARLESLGLGSLALDVLDMHSRAVQVRGLLVSRLCAGRPEAAAVYEEAGLRPPRSFADESKSEFKAGRIAAGVHALVVGQQGQQAVERCLQELDKMFSSTDWDLAAAAELIRPVCSVEAQELPEAMRTRLLCYSAFLGAQEAAARGYKTVTAALFRTVRSLQQGSGIAFPIPPLFMVMQEAQALMGMGFLKDAVVLLSRYVPADDRADAGADGGDDDTKPTAGSADAGVPMDHPIAVAGRKLLNSIQIRLTHEGESPECSRVSSSKVAGGALCRFAQPNEVVVAGANLPTGSAKSQATVSVISGKIVQGPKFRLGENFCCSLSEAIMWASVNPFSPLADGTKIVPF